MTVKEMHIELDLEAQYVSSSKLASLEDEEKDWLLNISMLQFINTRMTGRPSSKDNGFEENQKRVDDLKALKRSSSLAPFVSSSSEVFGILPDDYMHLITDGSNVEYNCNGITFVSSTHNKYIAVVPFLDDVNLYTNYSITANSGLTNLFLNSDYAAFSSGIASLESKFVLGNAILDIIRSNSDIELYWENFNNTYYPNSFIYVSDTDFNNIIVATTTGTIIYNTSAVSFNNYSNTVTETFYPNRLLSHEIAYKMNANYYGKSKYDSPISILNSNTINVIHDQTFIVGSIDITYIKKPRLISLALNQSCELDPNVHSEVVAIAVSKLKAYVNAPEHQKVLAESMIME